MRKDAHLQVPDKELVSYTTEMILGSIFLTHYGTKVFDQAERKSQKKSVIIEISKLYR